MRIDDENKVVWCSDELLNRIEEMPFDEVSSISRLVFLSTLSLGYDVPSKSDEYKWKKISDALFNNYEFKLEQPQKYYWRKKKEHLAWFEEEIYLTRFKFSDNENFVYILGSKVGSLQMTEPEAFHLLQHDFDKFEKVECE